MGERQFHAARGRHNKEASDHLLDETPFLDWGITALFYSALHWVHALLATRDELDKDERHPRKHSAPPGAQSGGRGVNQLVRDLFPEFHLEYRSLFEAGMRTRYDHERLGPDAVRRYRAQHQKIVQGVQFRLSVAGPPEGDRRD